MTLSERFLRYVSFPTASDEASESSPSSAGQRRLAAYLAEELSRCELAAGRLEGALAAAREGLPRTAGIYRTVAVSGALAVILVFL